MLLKIVCTFVNGSARLHDPFITVHRDCDPARLNKRVVFGRDLLARVILSIKAINPWDKFLEWE
jgi:hypothetical protein